MSATFGTVIKEYRRVNRLSMDEFAKVAGISKAYVGMLEKGTDYRTGKPVKPSLATLRKVAHGMNISMSELMRQAPDALILFDGEEDDLAEMYDNIRPMPGIARVPRLGAIACGEPILAEQNIEGYDTVPDYVKCDFTLICKGDSMINARIYDGDIVCIKQQPRVENGQIAAVLVDDEATLKRVRYIDGGVALMPENSKYEPLIFTGEEAERVRIIGLATHFISTVN